jgi:hypothetical protein
VLQCLPGLLCRPQRLRWLLEDFSVSVSMSTLLLSDSTEDISITRDPIKHELTKHVGVDAHFT